MPRGQRRADVPFQENPAIPFLSLALKVIKRLGWPPIIENHANSGFVKAHLAYGISGSISFTFRANLKYFRGLVLGAKGGEKMARSLKAVEIVTSVNYEHLLDDEDGIKAIKLFDSSWVRRLEKSLAKGLSGTRFSADAYVFRRSWKKIFVEERLTGAPRFAKGFQEWCAEEGWKYGISSSHYDRLISRCRDEDRYVDLAYESFGFEKLAGFLHTYPTLFPQQRRYKEALLECVSTGLNAAVGGQ